MTDCCLLIIIEGQRPEILLKNFLDGDYITNSKGTFDPVGVFNVNGDWIAKVSSESALISAWNSNPVNAAIGSIKSVKFSGGFWGVDFELKPNQVAPSKITVARYWQVTNQTGRIGLFTDLNDRIQVNNRPAILASASTGGINTVGLHTGASMPSPTNYDYVIANNNTYREVANMDGGAIANGDTFTVYHNETSYYAGFSAFFGAAAGSLESNLSGNFPLHVQKIHHSTTTAPTTQNTRLSNLGNYFLLDNVQAIRLIYNGGPGLPANLSTDFASITHLRKLKNICTSNSDYGAAFAASINSTNFPELQCFLGGILANVLGNPNVCSYINWNNINGANFRAGIDMRACGYSTADLDNSWIALASALNGVTPVTGAGITITSSFGAATATSVVARTYLQSQGWLIGI